MNTYNNNKNNPSPTTPWPGLQPSLDLSKPQHIPLSRGSRLARLSTNDSGTTLYNPREVVHPELTDQGDFCGSPMASGYQEEKRLVRKQFTEFLEQPLDGVCPLVYPSRISDFRRQGEDRELESDNLAHSRYEGVTAMLVVDSRESEHTPLGCACPLPLALLMTGISSQADFYPGASALHGLGAFNLL